MSSAILQQMATKIVFESQILPQVAIDDPFGDSPQGEDAPLMSWLKPKITVYTPAGPQTIAPWGEPTADYFPALALGVGVLSVFALYGAFKLVTK
jgi:hypothetical protein